MMYNRSAHSSNNLTAPADTEQNRFTKKVLSEKLDEPLQMIIFKDNKVLFIERKGNIKLYNPVTNTTAIIATIPVSTKYKNKQGRISEAEDGLLGVILDPEFYTNHWIYLYYSEAGDEPKNILTRYEYINHQLILASKTILLEVPVQREQCCHTGGKMAFDQANNLYLTTGDNTSSKATGYSPADEREGRSAWDAQRTSGNTNDLRGKILRIHPENDGTYTVPEGNLFPKGTPKTKPEIYVMGIRNPYSIFFDKRLGYLYWGEVGPDAGRDSANRGPRSYDEYNRTKKPGFFGWPFFVADNKPYPKVDFTNGAAGFLFDPDKPVNSSPNNTGLTNLPATNKPFIWYSYNVSEEFPVLGSGGRSAMVGPIYHADDYATSKKRFPDYYDGKLFIFEWLRDWIISVTLDKDGNYLSMERFLPDMRFSHPMDLKFGPDGDMYVLEYGQGWFTQNNDAQLVRISYNAGNRKPEVMVAADKTVGAVPLKINLSSAGTFDFDKDELSYKWTIKPDGGKTIVLKGENPSYTILKKGIFKATLTVTDTKGGVSSKSIIINAGNSPPVIDINVSGNQSFYFPGKPIQYRVQMHDKEDGIIPGGRIPANRLKVSIDYKSNAGNANNQPGHQNASEDVSAGRALLLKNDCKACHDETRNIIGPSYKAVALKYKDDPEAVERLAMKVINGGSGVWGEMSMSAHPQLKKEDAKALVRYVLSLASVQSAPANLGSKGIYVPPADAGGAITFKAAYTDKGVPGIPPAHAEKMLKLNSPLMQAASGKLNGDFQVFKKGNGSTSVLIRKESSVTFDNIDLTGISGLDFIVATDNGMNGGKIEIRLDHKNGTLLGTAKVQPNSPRTNIGVMLKSVGGKHTIHFLFSGVNTTEKLFFIDSIILKSD